MILGSHVRHLKHVCVYIYIYTHIIELHITSNKSQKPNKPHFWQNAFNCETKRKRDCLITKKSRKCKKKVLATNKKTVALEKEHLKVMHSCSCVKESKSIVIPSGLPV